MSRTINIYTITILSHGSCFFFPPSLLDTDQVRHSNNRDHGKSACKKEDASRGVRGREGGVHKAEFLNIVRNPMT
ncbi:hypothetical protein CEXT_433731 [Caerostris extrusa]|uniref:Uncharacterized protein n=1 Tax=Caerostris extrusa TaxID=172846 RepID=A0AAV4TPD9_CAEEX|nr:hypothetical protein CEXT_433731 [Caerostris extrusa]